MAKARANAPSVATHVVEVQPQQTDYPSVETEGNYLINCVTEREMPQKKVPYHATVTINSRKMKMEVDSGAACSLISEDISFPLA